MYRNELRDDGEEKVMKYALVGFVAVLIAGIFILAAVPMGSLGKAASSDHPSAASPKHDAKDNDTDDDEQNETHDNDSNVTAIAGGGGWQTVNMSGILLKDTFGIFIGDNLSACQFVFQARDQGVTVHSTNFTQIMVDNISVENATIVKAWGWALYDKTFGFWFQLVLVDKGPRANDMLELSIYKDLDKNWTMDEGSPLLQWTFDGLGGGNLWASSQDM